jgi:hypothetical protein
MDYRFTTSVLNKLKFTIMKTICLFFSLLVVPATLIAQETGKDAVVSASNMNVLYRGISNPVEIAVPGVSSDIVSATVTNGTIKRAAGGWEVSPGGEPLSVITVLVNNKKVSEKVFRIKNIPIPVAVFKGKSNGSMPRNTALENPELEAYLQDFVWDLKFEIKSFTFFYSSDKMDYEYKGTGNKLTDEMKLKMADFKKGQSIVFKDIMAVGPDGRDRELSPIILKIE